MSTEMPGTPEEQAPREQPVEEPKAEQPITPQPAAPAPPPPPTQPQTAPGSPSKDEITMGMLSHLLGLISFVGPLIIWLIKKDESAYVAEQAREALNFQITILIGIIAGGILSVIGIGVLIVWALQVVDLVFIIIATMQANQGVMYKYPFNLRLIK